MADVFPEGDDGGRWFHYLVSVRIHVPEGKTPDMTVMRQVHRGFGFGDVVDYMLHRVDRMHEAGIALWADQLRYDAKQDDGHHDKAPKPTTIDITGIVVIRGDSFDGVTLHCRDCPVGTPDLRVVREVHWDEMTNLEHVVRVAEKHVSYHHANKRVTAPYDQRT